MNKLKSITKGLVSCSLVLFVILSFLFSSTQAKDTINVIISPEYSFQTLKGWGTSLSWWGNAIGSWKNETKKNEILDLMNRMVWDLMLLVIISAVAIIRVIRI